MLYLAGYIATIFLANWAITTFGIVPVDFGLFGLMAPAGVYFAGLALSLRDGVQESMGTRWTAMAIIIGSALSALASPQFALASGCAFLISEAMDFMVYTPLRNSGRTILAILASNTVGLTMDSIIFLGLAFGSLDFIWGQVVGKFGITLLTIAIILALRNLKVLNPTRE